MNARRVPKKRKATGEPEGYPKVQVLEVVPSPAPTSPAAGAKAATSPAQTTTAAAPAAPAGGRAFHETTQEDFKKWEDNLKKQIPASEKIADFMANYPPEARIPPSSWWIDRKKKCVKDAQTEMFKRFEKNCTGGNQTQQKSAEEDPFAFHDEEEEGYSCSSGENMYQFDSTWGGYTKNDIATFCNSLPDCILLTTSFGVNGTDQRHLKHCYCPLSKTMAPWRAKVAKIEFIEKPCTPSNKRMMPRSLLAHLEKLGEKDPLHLATFIYLEKLYADYYRPELSHEAFYPAGTKKEQEALAAEKRGLFNKITDLQRNFAEQRSKILELHERIDSMQAKTIRNQRDAFENLGLDGTEKPVVVTEHQQSKFTRSWRQFWDMTRSLQNMCMKEDCNCEQIHVSRMEFEIPSMEDPTSEVLGKWERKFTTWRKDKANGYQPTPPSGWMIFADLNEEHFMKEKIDAVRQFLVTPKFNYQNTQSSAVIRGKLKRDHIPEDDGGPMRIFFQRLWDEIPVLYIEVRKRGFDPVKIELFGDFCIPVSDGILKMNIASAVLGKMVTNDEAVAEVMKQPAAMKVLEKVSRTYRAVGRLMLLSLAANEHIEATAMPLFFQNVVFRGIEPNSLDYLSLELYQHLTDIDLSWIAAKMTDEKSSDSETREQLDNEGNIKKCPENRLNIQTYVDCKSIAIENLRAGVMLDGLFNLQLILEPHPLKAFNKVCFSKADIQVEDIVKITKAMDITPGIDDEIQSEVLTKNQKLLVEQVFPEVLRDRAKNDKNFLSNFVEFVTGRSSLPHPDVHPKFKILLLFGVDSTWQIEDDENRKDISMQVIPVVHTCENSIMLPRLAYDANKEIFARKLDQAMEYSTKELDRH